MTQTHIKLVSEAETFQRENRYVVFKFKDVEQLSDEDRKALIRLSKSIEGVRAARGKTSFQAVIVESDWPEYETVWRMIEARMTGNSLQSAPEVDSKETGEQVFKIAGLLDYILDFAKERKHFQMRNFLQSNMPGITADELTYAVDYLVKTGKLIMHVEGFSPVYSLPEVGEAVDMDENTAKRFRGILSMLGISAPESDESLMLCQFSLLGMMRHKIQQIYAQPDRTAELEDKVKRLVESFGKLLGEAKTLAKLAKHAPDCLVNESLPTGMGTWGCTCGLNDAALDGELLNDTVYDALLSEMEAKGC